MGNHWGGGRGGCEGKCYIKDKSISIWLALLCDHSGSLDKELTLIRRICRNVMNVDLQKYLYNHRVGGRKQRPSCSDKWSKWKQMYNMTIKQR